MPLFQPRHLLATGLLGTALLSTLNAQTATTPVAAGSAASAEASAPQASGRFPLTVDSIMRGPALVGYPDRPPLVR